MSPAPATAPDPIHRFKAKLAQVQQALKAWSAGLSSASKVQRDLCLFWIDWIDKAEEVRILNEEECLLRPRLKERFEELAVQEELMWRQRSRMLWIQAGDANTKFFHRKACSRRTSNCIFALSTGSSSLSSHVDLAEHLFFFFSNQLPVPAAASHSINFRALYEDASALLTSLHQPFTMEEVKNAIFALAAEKAPGPDGFSLIFY